MIENGAEPSSIHAVEAGVHVADPPVLGRPEGLEDRPVDDVGADRDRRLEAEDEDEQRRHQRAAAHAGRPDEQADQQAGE